MPTRSSLWLLALASVAPIVAQQAPDPNFDVSVKSPAYTATHPRVVIDEAHHNFHTAGGRYRPFATLLRNDGYDVRPGTAPFTAASLSGTAVLVISNALGEGADVGANTSPPAFTDAECLSVLAWVRGGGALLLISDHTPMGEANTPLGKVFGVTMGRGFAFMLDPSAHRPAGLTHLVFSRANGLLGDHPITRGRNEAERIDTVFSFTGQSLTVPPGATPILALGPDAWEAPTRADMQAIGAELGETTPDPATFKTTRAIRVSERAQGLAFESGRGRVVSLGEAALMSAQVTGPNSQGRMGMNVPGSQDKQFALNILHWLTRLD